MSERTRGKGRGEKRIQVRTASIDHNIRNTSRDSLITFRLRLLRHRPHALLLTLVIGCLMLLLPLAHSLASCLLVCGRKSRKETKTLEYLVHACMHQGAVWRKKRATDLIMILKLKLKVFFSSLAPASSSCHAWRCVQHTRGALAAWVSVEPVEMLLSCG
jgi:hypothetical protein